MASPRVSPAAALPRLPRQRTLPSESKTCFRGRNWRWFKPTDLLPPFPIRLASWLADSTARVILIDKTFDFTSSEGTTTSAGCSRTTCTIAQGGQDYIGTLSCGASGMVPSQISYNKAGTTNLVVGSNKSIVGVGSKGVIKGKGLRLPSTTKNVIVQNVHLTVSIAVLEEKKSLC